MAATTADLVNSFLDLDQRIRAKEGELDKLKEARADLEAILLDRFEHAGMQSMKAIDGTVVYVRRDLWASAETGQEARLHDRLKQMGLGDMVREKVNTQTLSAYIRECEAAGLGRQGTVDEILQLLPPDLRGTVRLSERFSLRTKKG